MGSLIVFFLYILFIRNNMIQQFNHIPNGPVIMDMWLTGALLTVTAMTTAFSTLGQLIRDKTTNKFMDFKITGTKAFDLILGYFFSAFGVAFVMQILVAIISLSYFSMKETLFLTSHWLVKTVVLMLLSSFAATAMSLLLCSFIKSEATLRTFSSILGALSGFITSAYVPIGSLSGPAHTVIKLFPLSYATSSFRKVFMEGGLASLPSAEKNYLKNYLGYGYNWNGLISSWKLDLAVLVVFSIVCLIVVFLFSKRLIESTLSGRNQ
ncbi:hypothetical protein RV04_GL001374 [Enterococcus hermanniensis]|uniref:ABC-2 type transporter transmembrane domain-containing protein n=2 Tax=Enterococcus hermanniensis TaxID=249189 RepID=A0A1L8TPV3_9ENTE|nr:hypothetical protein RV04_GL001374 [Enterococcus hermanniensis]